MEPDWEVPAAVCPSSHCPAWCELRAGHGAHHSTTIADFVGDSDATVSVRLVAYAGGRPDVQLVAHDGDETDGILLDAEKARALAAILSAVGADDVARAVREACAVVEEAAS
jgi:hypothetical protein